MAEECLFTMFEYPTATKGDPDSLNQKMSIPHLNWYKHILDMGMAQP